MKAAIQPAGAKTAPYAVNATAGSINGAVASQWWQRPDDQRFLSLTELRDFVAGERDASKAAIYEAADIRVVADAADPIDLRFVLGKDDTARATHWSFGQLCALIQAPAAYLRKLPGTIAGINVQYGLREHRAEMIKAYVREPAGSSGTPVLRAITGPDYGRIYDEEIVEAVMRVAGNGTGDTHWKVPGVMTWRDGSFVHDPNAEITKRTTTLFASDRDVFVFLCDDAHPIEIGKLPNGDPDLVFRGFYVWNSEVGARSAGIATMYLRGVCQNRLLWGVEGFQAVTMRHSKLAPDRWFAEAVPALESYAQAATGKLLAGVKDAKAAIVARNDDDRREFLMSRGYSKAMTEKIIATVTQEEGAPPESIWDFVMGISAVARDIGHQDARIELERQGGRLLDKVAA